jgi:hypothetical protein
MLTRGNFIWTDGFGSKVMFVPTRLGRWIIAWIPDEEDQNKVVNKFGQVYPGNMDLTVSGADPYDHSTTTDGRRSNGASYTFRMYNPADEENTYLFTSEYIYRPDTVFQFYEDILRQSIFYGCQLLCENNRIGLINWFIEKGFKNYLMKRPEWTHTSNSRAQKTPGIPTSGETVRDSLISMSESYIVDACGMSGKVLFNRLIEDWLVFDANDWQKYDPTVAAGLTLLATKKNIKKPVEMNAGLEFVRKFRQNGNRSQVMHEKQGSY